MVTQLTSENFESEVKESEIPVIIDFWADWCGPCQMMGPTFEELSGEYSGKLKFVKLDTEEESDIARQFAIQGIPCLILTKKGQEVGRIVGFAPKDVLKEKIDALLEQA